MELKKIPDFVFQGVIFANNYGAIIKIPEGITTIGENCFLGCENIKKIILPDSVVDVGIFAFANSASKHTVTSLAELFGESPDKSYEDLVADVNGTFGGKWALGNAQEHYC